MGPRVQIFKNFKVAPADHETNWGLLLSQALCDCTGCGPWSRPCVCGPRDQRTLSKTDRLERQSSRMKESYFKILPRTTSEEAATDQEILEDRKCPEPLKKMREKAFLAQISSRESWGGVGAGCKRL